MRVRRPQGDVKGRASLVGAGVGDDDIKGSPPLSSIPAYQRSSKALQVNITIVNQFNGIHTGEELSLIHI